MWRRGRRKRPQNDSFKVDGYLEYVSVRKNGVGDDTRVKGQTRSELISVDPWMKGVLL